MKKLISFIFMLALVLSLPFSAHAAGVETYMLDELGMSIAIPSDYIVFTRDIEENDPRLSPLGVTRDKLLAEMESKNMYLDAMAKDASREITVIMTETNVSDYNTFGDAELSFLASSLESAYDDTDTTFLQSELYQHEQTKFVRVDLYQASKEIAAYQLRYVTVYGGKAINIVLHSRTGPINTDHERVIESIVDSVHFTAEPAKQDAPDKSPAFTYTDEETGTTFTVPANWVERELSKPRETIDAKFSSVLKNGLTIMYGSIDIFEMLSPNGDDGFSRADIDNSLFSLWPDVAEVLGVSIDVKNAVTYGGKEYFKAESTTTSTAYGIDLAVNATYVSRIENGYLYMFQFYGANDGPYYKDFETLLDSVQYPAVSDTSSTTRAGSTSDNFDIWSKFSIGNLLVSLIITVSIYSLPIIIYRYAIRKAPVEPKKARKITIIYAIFAVIVMTVLLTAMNGRGTVGGAIFLWSGVNYRVLTGGKSKAANVQTETGDIRQNDAPPSADTIPEQYHPQYQVPEDPPACSEQKIFFCPSCGAKVPTGAVFCRQCGTKLYK